MNKKDKIEARKALFYPKTYPKYCPKPYPKP
jgi:hypothetical protein